MFFHTVDGNFHSSQKMKPMDPSDFSLTNAAGYYVEEKEFSHFQKEFKPPKKEVSAITREMCQYSPDGTT